MTSSLSIRDHFLAWLQLAEINQFYWSPGQVPENKVVRPLPAHMDTKAPRANDARHA
ncbi:hypothetical protein C4K40_2598 [Pseudomonas sp. CMR5c]|nr:hypothetical protein C4K40_2598 [Pseudomonas sp. CMR5c]